VNERPAPEPVNSVDIDLNLRAIVLRRFTFELHPLRESWQRVSEDYGPPMRGPVNGLELRAVAVDTGLKVSLRFERGEFVNIATAGLHMLDAADALATDTEGGGDNG
jgi:hypothetical protein